MCTGVKLVTSPKFRRKSGLPVTDPVNPNAHWAPSTGCQYARTKLCKPQQTILQQQVVPNCKGHQLRVIYEDCVTVTANRSRPAGHRARKSEWSGWLGAHSQEKVLGWEMEKRTALEKGLQLYPCQIDPRLSPCRACPRRHSQCTSCKQQLCICGCISEVLKWQQKTANLWGKLRQVRLLI